MTHTRVAVNPTTWSQAMGFNQGEISEGHARTLFLSGQTAMSPEGTPEHPGDMAGQLTLALRNLESVLAGAGMTLSHLIQIRVYSTDIDALMPHYGILAGRLAEARVQPTTTMLGVTRLAVAGQLVELEGTAVAPGG